MSQKSSIIVTVILVTVAVLVFSILLGVSFVKLEYYEFGLKQKISSGKVDTSKVYTGGSYIFGPDYTFKRFPATAHVVDLDEVWILSADNLEVGLSASFHYYIRKNEIPLLFKNYDVNYQESIENNALSAFKNAVPVFSLDDMIKRRKVVEATLFEAVKKALSGLCCEEDCHVHETCVPGCIPRSSCNETDQGLFVEVRYFNLAQVNIPDDIEKEFLRSVVLKEETKKQEYDRQAQRVLKETQRQVNLLNNEAAEITAEAAAEADLVQVQAAANATEIVETARANGLSLIFNATDITTEEDKNYLHYIRTLQTSSKARIAMGYDQFVQYSGN